MFILAPQCYLNQKLFCPRDNEQEAVWLRSLDCNDFYNIEENTQILNFLAKTIKTLNMFSV